MDIELLSKMVKELILDNDVVGLPGMGYFVAQMVPSSFSDKGYMIHPPYRRLSFRSAESDDSLLVSLYAKSNNIDVKVAEGIVKEFVSQLKDYLRDNRTVQFPGLGKLRSTRENVCFFVSDEDLDIWPSGAGMEPVSLKTHQDKSAQTLASIKTEYLSQVRAEPDSEPFVETPLEDTSSPDVPEPEKTAEAAPSWEPVPRVWRTAVCAILALLALFAFFLAIFIIVAHFCPDFIDRFLYSAEELSIINYGK